jgi:ribosomal protein L37AE/L43A
MIDQIRNDDVYDRFGQRTSYSKLGVDSATGIDLNILVKLRDIALISFNWIYFKRAREVLGLTFGSIGVAENALSETETYKVMTVSVNIEKKRKRYKICPKCKFKDQPLKNSLNSNFCKKCGRNIEKAQIIEIGAKAEPKTKSKDISEHYTQYVMDWVNKLKSLGAQKNWWLFPKYNVLAKRFMFTDEDPIGVARYDQILQRLDPTMSSCMFRYGGTEKHYRLGYTSHEIADIGDWSSDAQPERYAKRLGLTPSQQKFSRDKR